MSSSFHVIAHSIKLESATTLLRYKGFLVNRPYLCLSLLYPLISYVRNDQIRSAIDKNRFRANNHPST